MNDIKSKIKILIMIALSTSLISLTGCYEHNYKSILANKTAPRNDLYTKPSEPTPGIHQKPAITSGAMASTPITNPITADVVVSDNHVDCNDDNHQERLMIKMVTGKYIEENSTTVPTSKSRYFQGQFIAMLLNGEGKVISQYLLGDNLIYPPFFNITFEEYNGDGNIDFGIVQRNASHQNHIRLFTIHPNGQIAVLPVDTQLTCSSNIFSPLIRKVAKNAIRVPSYDNSIEYTFTWANDIFKLTKKSSIKKRAVDIN